ncbi:unnamed protein product [Rotaria sordida]|uniref:Aminoglycoside phosphotransferase domain-containing protein n=1 Tax=Rotaria sordida TaxID=392033 RepID=A0A814VR68_9BILA|nr:unnamed protein product [Rotaria sordida]
MEDRIKKILFNEYNLNVEKLTLLEGGFRPDEIYLLITVDQMKYVVKYIEYNHSLEHLQSILIFENILHDLYKYPCPKIILSINKQLFIFDNQRCLFVQTFIQGIEPNREIIDKNNSYLHQMGSLLAQWRIASSHYSLNIHFNEEDQELTEKWWNKQQINNIDPFLLSNVIECKEYFRNLNVNFQHGLIHNDFHTNNSIITNDEKIYIIDFVDACQSVFISDLGTSLFHLLIDKHNGEHRAKTFLEGYQQILKLTLEEKDALHKFVQFKLTMSIIADLNASCDLNEPFIQSCFDLLKKLKNNSTLVNNLLE